jgi:hypothetical protein
MNNEQNDAAFEIEVIEEATAPVDCLCNTVTCP